MERVIEIGKKILGRKLVQTGVESMIKELTLDATFSDGLKRVKIEYPICSDYGDFDYTFHGSFLPKPSLEVFKSVSNENDVDMTKNGAKSGSIPSASTTTPGMIVPFKVCLDEGEITDINSSAYQNLTNFIDLNKDKGASILLSVNNLGNQSIKV